MQAETEEKKQNELGTERVSKLMLRFAIPSVISIVVNSLYNMVDQVFIGQGVGYLGNAGTNIVMPMATILMALTMMVGAGASTYVSLNLGRGEPEQAARGAGNAMTLSVVIGVGMMLLCELFMEPLCRFFGATDSVLPYAVAYGRIVVLGFPFSAIDCAFGDLIRADCRPKETMAGLLIGCFTNMILDPLYIFAFHWGVEGAAWATITGQFLNAVFYLWRARHFTTIRLDKSCFVVRWSIARKVMLMGISNLITQISSVVVMTVLNNLLTIYGPASEYGADIPLAVLGIVVKISQLASGIALGIATGCQPILSYNYGSGQYARVKRTYKTMLLLATCIMVLARIVLWVYPEQIIGLFGQESELYVAFAIKCFNIFLLAIPVVGVSACTSILFQSVGMATISAFLSLTRQVLFFVPAMVILSRLLGVDGVLWGAAISDSLAFVTALLLLAVFWRRIFQSGKSAAA